MKSPCLTFIFFFSSVLGVGAATITLTNTFTDSYAVLDFQRNPIPTGSGSVAIGSFSIDDATIRALYLSHDAVGVLQRFNQFNGNLTMGSLVPGFYQGTVSGSLSEGNPLVGREIYTLIGGWNYSYLYIYKHEGLFFQPDPGITPDAALVANPANVLWGVVTTVSINGESRLAITFVPEPSTAVFLWVSSALVLFRRQRCRH